MSYTREQFLATNGASVAPTGDLDEFTREFSRYAHLLPRDRALNVLDVGCGSGPWSLRWVEHGAHVTGLDFDIDLLRIALRRPGLESGRFRAILADARSIPAAPESFDLITLNSILEHVPDWGRVVSEAARTLAPGGILVIHTANRWHPLQGEINHFPFYPWLPEAVKRRVLAWIMRHRPDLVNYTDYPAINWFGYPQMKRALERCGLIPYDRLDFPAPTSRGPKAAALRFLRRKGRVRRAAYFAAVRTVSVYAQKPHPAAE